MLETAAFVPWPIQLTLAILLLPLFLQHTSCLRYYTCYISYVGCVMIFTLFYIPIFLFSIKSYNNLRKVQVMARPVTRLLGIEWEFRCQEAVPEDGAVIVANHQSLLDVLGLFNYWDIFGKCTAVARKEIFYYWPFGLGAWLAGIVFIDRDNGQKAIRQLRAVATSMHRDKAKLMMFPEGTRNRHGNSLLPFKKGAFRIAIEAQVPIIPIVISPYSFINSNKKYFGKGRMIIKALERITTKGLTLDDLDMLLNKTWDVMEQEYQMLKREVDTIQASIVSL